jgi:hypothetical protein
MFNHFKFVSFFAPLISTVIPLWEVQGSKVKRFRGSGFRGSGFRGSGFRGSGFKGSGFRVQGSGCWLLVTGCWSLVTGFVAGSWKDLILDSRFWILDTR